MLKKRSIIIGVLMALCVILAFISNHQDKGSQNIIAQNIEALTDGEEGGGHGFMRLGHHVEICGALMIEWNGVATNCTQLKTVCDFVNQNDCIYQGCPIHG